MRSRQPSAPFPRPMSGGLHDTKVPTRLAGMYSTGPLSAMT